MLGWETTAFSDLRTPSSLWFEGGESLRTGVPTSIASLSTGSVARRSSTPGRSSVPSRTSDVRNGRWRGSTSIPVSSVGAVSVMVSCRAPASALNAANVIAAFVNTSACCSATGATIRATLPSAGKKRRKRVDGSIRTFVTGRRPRNSGCRLEIASLSEVPRPAKALPKPSRLVRTAVRVFVSKVLAMSSNSVCVWKHPFRALAGIESEKPLASTGSAQLPLSSVPSKVKPSGAFLPSPRMISTYLRPKVDR